MTNKILEAGKHFFTTQDVVTQYTVLAAVKQLPEDAPIDPETLDQAIENSDQFFESLPPTLKEDHKKAIRLEMWPPDFETQKHLSTVSGILQKTEQKTGVKFGKMVAVNPTNSGFFALMGEGTVLLDYGAIRGESLSHKDLADIINHEAAHSFYGDNAIYAPLRKAIGFLNQINVMTELHRDNPNLFYKYVQENFSSIDKFESYLSEWNQKVTAFYQQYAPFIDMKHQDILADHYSDKKVQTTIEKLPETAFQELNVLNMMSTGKFPVMTKEQAAIFQENLEKSGVLQGAQKEQIEQFYGNSFTQDQAVEIKISEADSSRIDTLLQEQISPLSDYSKKLSSLSYEIRMAAEFRADDFCIIFSDHPKTAHEALEKMEKMMENMPKPGEQFPNINLGEQDPHPPLPVRIERQKKLGEYVAALRAKKGPEANLLEYLDMSIGAISRLPTEVKPRGFGHDGI